MTFKFQLRNWHQRGVTQRDKAEGWGPGATPFCSWNWDLTVPEPLGAHSRAWADGPFSDKVLKEGK